MRVLRAIRRLRWVFLVLAVLLLLGRIEGHSATKASSGSALSRQAAVLQASALRAYKAEQRRYAACMRHRQACLRAAARAAQRHRRSLAQLSRRRSSRQEVPCLDAKGKVHECNVPSFG